MDIAQEHRVHEHGALLFPRPFTYFSVRTLLVTSDRNLTKGELSIKENLLAFIMNIPGYMALVILLGISLFAFLSFPFPCSGLIGQQFDTSRLWLTFWQFNKPSKREILGQSTNSY